MDQFARELLTAEGSTYEHPEANYYRRTRTPDELAEVTAELFMGVRLRCARCHNHPFDRWTRADYYRFAAFFGRSLEIAERAGIARNNIVLDPGIGFGKTPEQSMTALARLNELTAFGLPLLVGASRKRFISSVVPSEPDQRLGGSIAAHVVAAKGGARIIRTHDVSETVQALRVAAAIWDRR